MNNDQNWPLDGAACIIPVTRVSNGIWGKAEFDTLGKTVSAQRAGGHTPHEGWVPHLRCVEGGRGEFPPLTHHK